MLSILNKLTKSVFMKPCKCSFIYPTSNIKNCTFSGQMYSSNILIGAFWDI